MRVPEETLTEETASLISATSVLPETVKLFSVPTDVKEDPVTPDPSADPVKTSVPSILYVFPEAISKLSSVFSVSAADLYRLVSAVADPDDHFNFPPCFYYKIRSCT